MTRIVGMFGFAALFLLISPALRSTVVDASTGMVGLFQNYSPYSYIGGALLLFGGVTVTLATGSSPR